MFLDLSQVHIPIDRIRKEYAPDEFNRLKDSIRHGGLINAITVTSLNGHDDYELKTGEHRYQAVLELNAEGHKIPNLPPGQIRAEIWGQMTRRTALLHEWDENNQRVDFNFEEKAKFIRLFHETMIAETKGDWTQELTAHMLRISTASISHYLRIEEAAKEHPEVNKAVTMKAAVKRMKKIEKLKNRKEEVDRQVPEAVKRAEQILACADARDWIRDIPDGSIDLVNFDPPWGEEASHKVAENWEVFEDSTEYSWELTISLLPELYRVLKQDRFLILWLRILEAKNVIDVAKQAGFAFKYEKTPCIWYKPDKVSDQQRFPEKTLIDSYETFILLRKGDPVLHEQGSQNLFVEPRLISSQTMHPTEKPVSLMTRILKLLSGPGETILDPCAGSASFLESGILNYRRVNGCEKSPQFHERGVTRLAEVIGKFTTEKK
jgi:adenine-specific DNA-methyltransferase